MSANDYKKILKESQENEDIVGLILVGSRGKGFDNEYSDYDMIMIVKDDVWKTIYDKYEPLSLDNVDLNIYSQTDFNKYAGWESADAWDRYDYAHTKILVNKTEDLQKILDKKGTIPKEKQKEFIESWIDGYVNGVYRSVKCIRNNNLLGAHLEAVNSMLDILTLVFGMNGRHRPFLGYIEKEMRVRPLERLPWSPDEFFKKLKKVLETADLETQQELLKGIEKMSREMNYGYMFDGWEGKDKWTMEFKL